MFSEFDELRDAADKSWEGDDEPLFRKIMVIVVSLTLLAAGLILVIKEPAGNSQTIGAGLLGLVSGYWIK